MDKYEFRRLKSKYMYDYPDLEPCINCNHWRRLDGGNLYKPAKLKPKAKEFKPIYGCHCDKSVWTEEQKLDLYINHHCDYQEEREDG